MLLNEDQRMVRDSVRAFVQERIAPKAAAWDKSTRISCGRTEGPRRTGCYGIAVPDQYGGARLDYTTLAIILEEIAASDGQAPAPWCRSTTARVLDHDAASRASSRSRTGWCRWRAARCSARFV